MIHALPGMGADRRMYSGAWTQLPNFCAHDWPAYCGETTISQLAESVVEHARIVDGDYLIGTSLGGIVACEIARLRKIRRLYLIASAVEPGEVSVALRVLHPLASFAPIGLMQLSAKSVSGDVGEMFSSVEAEFIRRMSGAVFRWPGLQPNIVPVVRIHGSRDHVITAPKRVDLLLDGGHLLTISHAEECVKYIADSLTSR